MISGDDIEAMDQRTAEEWLKDPQFEGYTILDPDGWRHEGMSWDDKLTVKEFEARLQECTVLYCAPKTLAEKILDRMTLTGESD